MSYTRNFGMRSFENIVRDGRFRVPATGNQLRIGSAVTLDPAAPGFLKQAVVASPRGPQSGIAVYEHIQLKGVDAATASISDGPFALVPLGSYSQMIHGVGTKIWLKRTATRSLYDGSSLTGFDPLPSIDLTALNIGDGLTPAATAGQWAVAGNGVTGWLIVEQVNPTSGVVEARFSF